MLLEFVVTIVMFLWFPFSTAKAITGADKVWRSVSVLLVAQGLK
jgi:hypothetical protein